MRSLQWKTPKWKTLVWNWQNSEWSLVSDLALMYGKTSYSSTRRASKEMKTQLQTAS